MPVFTPCVSHLPLYVPGGNSAGFHTMRAPLATVCARFGIDTGSIVPKVMHQLGERLSLFKVTGCNRAAELLTALVEVRP